MPINGTKIYSVNDLIFALKSKSKGESYMSALNNIEFGFNEIEHLCFWDRDSYSKISIDKNDDCELVLICWEKDQKSPIHNHDLDEAWTYVLKGKLTEEIYNSKDTSTIENSIVLNKKDVSSIKRDAMKVHRLINTNEGRSVSLHLYKK